MLATTRLDEVARAIVADGKGILAADETVPTLTKRFAAHGLESTPESRRAWREMLFATPDVSSFIGGVILHDEAITQKNTAGVPLADVLAVQGIIPGIKVDNGAHPLAGAPGELITEGLDDLRERLERYRRIGLRFAKWRAVIGIGDRRPTARCIHANAEAIGRYAALCQEQDVLPIVQPEVLMDGTHRISRCEEATDYLLQAVFDALDAHRVSLEAMLLEPNMVLPGRECPKQASLREVADASWHTIARHVPPAVPAIVFLSGGQDHVRATEHLSAINQLARTKPWVLSFCFGRALQDEALDEWQGRPENVAAAQRAFRHRARCLAGATHGTYGSAMEREAA